MGIIAWLFLVSFNVALSVLSLISKLYLANYLPNAGLGEHATKLYPGNHLSSTEPHSAIDKIIMLLFKCKDVYQFST